MKKHLILFSISYFLLIFLTNCSKENETKVYPKKYEAETQMIFEDKLYHIYRDKGIDYIEFELNSISPIQIPTIDSFGEKVDVKNIDGLTINSICKNEFGIYILFAYESTYSGKAPERILLINNNKLIKDKFLPSCIGNPYHLQGWFSNSIIGKTDDIISPITTGQFFLFDKDLNKILFSEKSHQNNEAYFCYHYYYYSEKPFYIPISSNPQQCISWDDKSISLLNIKQSSNEWNVIDMRWNINVNDLDKNIDKILIKDIQYYVYNYQPVFKFNIDITYFDGTVVNRNIDITYKDGNIL